jgi:hypothetical protein
MIVCYLLFLSAFIKSADSTVHMQESTKDSYITGLNLMIPD